jgi:hypothetical protein
VQEHDRDGRKPRAFAQQGVETDWAGFRASRAASAALETSGLKSTASVAAPPAAIVSRNLADSA